MAGLADRFTAKVGPLPVWAWALTLLVGGYLVYRLTSSRSSSSSDDAPSGDTSGGVPAGTDTTPITEDSGYGPAGGQGNVADNFSGDLLSQLSGFQSSIDGLTAAVQLSPAFWPGGDVGSSGSGSIVPNNGAAPVRTTPKPKPNTKAAAKPAPKHFYTYAPGKAPKGKAAMAAPKKAPAGKKLHFQKGKGYYYA